MKGFSFGKEILKRSIWRSLKCCLAMMGKEWVTYCNMVYVVSLVGHPSLSSAYSNDVDAELIFAQQLFGYSRKGDVLCVLSTSGNSKNIIKALQVAKVIGIKSIAMTGQSGRRMCEIGRLYYKSSRDGNI